MGREKEITKSELVETQTLEWMRRRINELQKENSALHAVILEMSDPDEDICPICEVEGCSEDCDAYEEGYF